MSDDPEKPIEQVVAEDGRYPIQAFAFLHEGLARAVHDVYGEIDTSGGSDSEHPTQHVSGQQLCEGIRAEAIDRWGLLARTVLERWNIRATIDFGEMVYLLINSGHMRKTESDSIEDFRDVFGFDTAFNGEGVFESDDQA